VTYGSCATNDAAAAPDSDAGSGAPAADARTLAPVAERASPSPSPARDPRDDDAPS